MKLVWKSNFVIIPVPRYPLYYQVGANWASEQYESTEFPWCDAGKLAQTGVCGTHRPYFVRFLLQRYLDVRGEREKICRRTGTVWKAPMRLRRKATEHKEGLVGSLFIEQYREHPERLQEAMSVCFAKTGGCMIFDLSYIINYDWWDYMKRVSLKPLEVSDAGEVYELCRGTFREEYHIAEERILGSLFEDPDFSAEESKKIVDEKTEGW